MTSKRSTCVRRRPVSGGSLIQVEGDIDASFKPGSMTAVERGEVVIDMDGVSRITSFGVRTWLHAVRELKASYLAYVNVRPSVVMQFNMVGGFDAGGEVVTLYLPYACPDCDEEFDHLLDLRREHAVIAERTLPAVCCPRCESPAEFDDVPQAYLHFLSLRLPPAPPPLSQRLIDGDMQPATLTVRKEVTDEVTAVFLEGPLNEHARLKRSLAGLEGTVVMNGAELRASGPEHLPRLQPLFGAAAQGAEVYFAQLRPEVARLLAGYEPAGLAGRLISVVLDVDCQECGLAFGVELDKEALRRSHAGHVMCPECDHEEKSRPMEGFADLAALVCPEVPDAISLFLARVPEEPPGDPAEQTRAGFEILRRLGTGGMAEVLLARRHGRDGFSKKVALKRILPGFADNQTFIQLFLQEARTAARVNHPNVVQIYDLGRDEDGYFIAMEFVRGWDLRTVLRLCRQLPREMPIEIVCRIAADMCAGLHAAHTCVDDDGRPLRIVHRDISPHNVLLSKEGAVKVSDFGVAKAADSTVQTRTGALRGKVPYMAPEQVDPLLGRSGPVSDVFSAGLVLYEMLTLVCPFKREDDIASMRAVLATRVDDPKDLRPDLPAPLVALLRRVLTQDPARRTATARDLQLSLEDILATLEVPASASHLARWLEALEQAGIDAGELSPPPAALVPGEAAAPPDTETGTIRMDRGSSARRDPVPD